MGHGVCLEWMTRRYRPPRVVYSVAAIRRVILSFLRLDGGAALPHGHDLRRNRSWTAEPSEMLHTSNEASI